MAKVTLEVVKKYTDVQREEKMKVGKQFKESPDRARHLIGLKLVKLVDGDLSEPEKVERTKTVEVKDETTPEKVEVKKEKKEKKEKKAK